MIFRTDKASSFVSTATFPHPFKLLFYNSEAQNDVVLTPSLSMVVSVWSLWNQDEAWSVVTTWFPAHPVTVKLRSVRDVCRFKNDGVLERSRQPRRTSSCPKNSSLSVLSVDDERLLSMMYVIFLTKRSESVFLRRITIAVVCWCVSVILNSEWNGSNACVRCWSLSVLLNLLLCFTRFFIYKAPFSVPSLLLHVKWSTKPQIHFLLQTKQTP